MLHVTKPLADQHARLRRRARTAWRAVVPEGRPEFRGVREGGRGGIRVLVLVGAGRGVMRRNGLPRRHNAEAVSGVAWTASGCFSFAESRVPGVPFMCLGDARHSPLARELKELPPRVRVLAL